mgnify:FL=1
MKLVKLLILKIIKSIERNIIGNEIRKCDLVPIIFFKKKELDSQNEKLFIIVIIKIISIALIFFVLYNNLHVISNY